MHTRICAYAHIYYDACANSDVQRGLLTFSLARPNSLKGSCAETDARLSELVGHLTSQHTQCDLRTDYDRT